MTTTTLRADFRIEKKKTTRLQRHWQAFWRGFRLCYTSPFLLNILTGGLCVVLISSITLLQKLPLNAYCTLSPRIIILLDHLPSDQIQALHQKIEQHSSIRTVHYISPQLGFKRFIENLDNQNNAFINLKNTALEQAKNLPHVFEVSPQVSHLQSPQLSSFLNELKRTKGIVYIQSDKTAAKVAHNEYMQYKQRITRFIGLLFIVSIIVLCHPLHSVQHLPSFSTVLYHSIWLILLLSGISSLGLNQINYFLTALFLLPYQTLEISFQQAYVTNLFNTFFIISISFLLSRFFKWQTKKQ